MIEYCTPKELARLLRVHMMTIYRMMYQGKLSATKYGRMVRISKDDIEKLIGRELTEDDVKIMIVNDPRESASERKEK